MTSVACLSRNSRMIALIRNLSASLLRNTVARPGILLGNYAAPAQKCTFNDYNFTAMHSSYAFIAIVALQKEAYVAISHRGTPPILPRWLFPSGGF
ncbi:hypothetical protein QFZ34_002508 [Phyllobacterium ifriqiyense]|uniref:Uncharacterized protein n=1 Tax=Phyllobacterium ifriqiyense TaxID=314238 RepID=A0ABU0SA26_9HYPH|nr:hypothetical protein [Phyllobacterium ifriqiyense]